MRKLISLLLAMTMVFSLAITVSAQNNSITINNAKVGETYKLYKLFDLVVDSESAPTKYSYTVNASWKRFFEGTGANLVLIDEEGYVTDINPNNASTTEPKDDAAVLAEKAAAWANANTVSAIKTQEATDGMVSFANLDAGYWLITSTLGTVAMTETTPDKNAVSVNEKNPENTITKTVKEDSTGGYGATNDAQIGDIVEFKSTVKIVKGTRNVVVHDKMDSGLTYTAGSVAIDGLTKGTEFAVNESPADGDTFDITFTQSWIDGLAFGTDGYKEYEITYTAVLNKNAVVKGDNGVAIEDQENKTHVSFGDASSSTEVKTTTTTHKFSVFKHAKDSTANLAGAVFELKKGAQSVALIQLDDNNYRVATSEEINAVAPKAVTTEPSGNKLVSRFTTVAEGDIVIWGVDADTDYSLEEVSPPGGYNRLKDSVSVTVDADNSTRVDVENNAGTELPSTGGMGTTLFYILGGVFLVAGVILLVIKKRMGSVK